jgi:hypothetical protein
LSARDKILTEIATSDWINQVAKNIGGKHSPEMVQEFMLYLCQLPDHKLEELTTKYNIKWYAIRSFVNMIHGNTRTQFFKNNLRISETLPDNVDTIPDESRPDKEVMYSLFDTINFQTVAIKFDRAEWYVVRLWELYQQHISMAAMAKMTKINYREIQQIINEIKKQLNDNYNAIID